MLGQYCGLLSKIYQKGLIGSIQLCGGQVAGCEAAVHAVQKLFDDESTEAILLVDAINAINRQAALHNNRFNCPAISKILLNFYRKPSFLWLNDSFLMSEEGTTQGDPFAMPMYSIPLIRKLKHDVKQVWYADDAYAVGSLSSLHSFWSRLTTLGPKFGYFLNAKKSWFVTKDVYLTKDKAAFENIGIQITSDGRP